MDKRISEGQINVLDHVGERNRRALQDWEERLWQRQLNGDLIDFRDETLRRSYRDYQRKVGEFRHVAQRLHALQQRQVVLRAS